MGKVETLSSIPDGFVKLRSGLLFNSFNSDSVDDVEEFSSGSQEAIVVVRNVGTFVRATIQGGVGSAQDKIAQDLAAGSVVLAEFSAFGDIVAWRITINLKNLTNEITGLGAAVNVSWEIWVEKPEPPPPPPKPRPVPPPGPPVKPQPGPVERIYTVKHGDFLRRIAKVFYGDPDQWRKIYNANKSVIGRNPDRIFPGQRLVIP